LAVFHKKKYFTVKFVFRIVKNSVTIWQGINSLQRSVAQSLILILIYLTLDIMVLN